MITPSTTPEAEAAQPVFEVDAVRCIGCVACLNVFPGLFQMDEDVAVAAGKAPIEPIGVSRVLQCCPVDAISQARPAASSAGPETAATEPELAAAQLTVVTGWEEEWARCRNLPEDLRERERRYGRIHTVREIEGGFVLRVELPRGLPNHELLVQYGIPRVAPEYECRALVVPPDIVSVRTRLLDPRLRLLAGKLNSFPTGFKLDYRFPREIGTVFRRVDLQDLFVYALPAGASDPLTMLRRVVREHLAIG